MNHINFKTLFILFFSTSFICYSAYAQNNYEGKAYIFNGKIVMPITDNQIALLIYDSIGSEINQRDSLFYVLPTGVSRVINNKIPFCLFRDRLISMSLRDFDESIMIGPDFVGIDINNLYRKYDDKIKTIFTLYKKTYHYGGDILCISGSKIRQGLVKNRYSENTSFDIEFNAKDSLYLAIANENGFYIHCVSFKELPFCNELNLSFDNMLRFNQIMAWPKLDTKEFNLAFVKNNLFIIDSQQSVFRFDKEKLNCIYKNKENAPKTPDDSLVIVDKDNQALYLSSKEMLKNYKGTMTDFLKLCTRVPIE